MVVGVLAIGQTLVILTAGIDLSCGTVMAFGQIVMTKLAVANGVDPLAGHRSRASLACVVLRSAERRLVTGVGLPAFIVTLGTLNIAFALTHIYSNDETVLGAPAASSCSSGGTSRSANAKSRTASVLMFVLFAIAWYALTQTAWGRHVYAVGDNLEAARLMGIKTKRVLLERLHGRRPHLRDRRHAARGSHGARRPERRSDDENLDAITAVVLGGTSLFGGRGTVIGTLIGAIDGRRVPEWPDADRRGGRSTSTSSPASS